MSNTPIVYLFDVDNTLLDNDAVTADLRGHLAATVGDEQAGRYWEIFEQLRSELGYADYLGALQRYRGENPREMRLLTLSRFLIDYPFVHRVYHGALAAVKHARNAGTVAILSDGDVVFQPHKVERSGLGPAVGGNVLIYVHKEGELEDVERRFPADHYVLIDDKLRIHAAVKKIWGRRLTTVFVAQGHYADPAVTGDFPPADISIARIGDFCGFDAARLRAAAR